MSTASPRRFKGKSRDKYLELVQVFPLISLRSDSELKAAQDVMGQIFAKGTLSPDEEMYLDALSDLIAAYEDKHHPIEPPTDAAMLRHLMEAKGVSQIELHTKTGIAKSTISEILAGKKPFSRKIIRTLSEYFHVEPGLLAANI
ncbi:MAG: helix-turn-helix domain-containing protein [Planctomycetota bacterium]|nr:helix-turn-helix domain-containing protein [Planctomycetota bacterium]MDA1211618.1 helix-turn-helix domain-containing protein [Planctomycetota bacterium]